MENWEPSALAEAIARRLFVELEASGRHVHVTAQQALVLFGHPLTPKRPLSQPGQYLSNERVTVIGPKGELGNVAVLGPERKDAQVEISLTDARTLGIDAPVRLSGDVAGSPGGVIVGQCGRVTLPHGVDVAADLVHDLGGKSAQILQFMGNDAAGVAGKLGCLFPGFPPIVHMSYTMAPAWRGHPFL